MATKQQTIQDINAYMRASSQLHTGKAHRVTSLTQPTIACLLERSLDWHRSNSALRVARERPHPDNELPGSSQTRDRNYLFCCMGEGPLNSSIHTPDFPHPLNPFATR